MPWAYIPTIAKKETERGSLGPNQQTPCSMGELVIKNQNQTKTSPPTKKKQNQTKKNPQDGEIPKTDLWLPHTQVHMSMCIPTHSTLTNHTHLN